MNGAIKCDKSDLDPNLNDFFPDIEVEQISEEITNTEVLEISKENPFVKLATEQTYDQRSSCSYIAFYYAILFLYMIGLFGFLVSVLFSYLCCLITLFMFFISFVTSYIMCPVYHFLDNDYINFFAALLQAFLSSPLIAFFLFLFTNLFRKAGDIIEAFKDMLLHPFSKSFKDKEMAQDIPCKLICIMLVYSVLFVITSALLVWLTFCQKGGILVEGIIVLIPMFVEIIILLFPEYIYWFKLLFDCKFCRDFEKDDCSKRIDEKCISKVVNIIEIYDADSDSDDEKKINQTTQTFFIDKGQISPKIGYSQKFSDINEINYFVAEQEEYDSWSRIFVFVRKTFRHTIFMKELIPLYEYGKSIVQNAHKKTLKRVLLWIFTLLNIALIGFDIYRAIHNHDNYFLTATILRAILIPLYSYYHWVIHFITRIKDKALRVAHYLAFAFTIIAIVAIFACFAMKEYYKRTFSIEGFKFKPIDTEQQYYNYDLLSHPVCLFDQFGVNAIDAYSYSIGVYDVVDNPKVFNEEMKTFFAENYNSFITYEVQYITDEVPFVIYHNSLINTTIVVFRGFKSGPEIAFFMQMVAELYVIPFFSDLVPFMETITSFFLEYPIGIAHQFGRMMFDPTNSIKTYADKVQKICESKNIDKLDRVIFTGIGVGATLGKIVSINFKKYSISFLTLPLWNDFFTHVFDLDENDMSYITNVYIYESMFAKPEPEYATNIGIFPPPFNSSIPKTA